MNSKELKLEIEPMNFVGFIFKSFLSMFLILFIASIIFAFVTPNLKNNYTVVIIIAGLIMALILGIQFIFRPTIYLYSIFISETITELKWQENRKFKSRKFNNAKIKTELIPSGKNNPYLKIEIKDKESNLTLKQYQVGEWDLEKLKQIGIEIKNTMHNNV
ncbi:hypothetical protein [Tenacibaculum crassostreae]|uniref:hypothetical protein n=1 Tax=Tenacibaculum crassostreae TaxID=502683 RepID=UPI0038932083